ncbi:MAG TPA: LPS assembly protein LptD [Acidobacteriaceae bacterium]|nr:LPS assembly protein LptD [Acidobacteriaceae bacterium]
MSIIAPLAVHPHLLIAQVSNPAPPPRPGTTADISLPDLASIPRATPLPPEKAPDIVSWNADTQSRHDSVYLLSGNVEVTYQDHLLRADTISYDEDTHDLTANGHVHLSGGDNDEYLTASHGTYNLKTGTGRFYDVTGSIGLHGSAGVPNGRSSSAGVGAAAPDTIGKTGLITPNPFLFSGKVVVKTGPRRYDVYDGSVTSCLLPRPDWLLTSSHLSLNEDQARAGNTVFHLLGMPLFFLPYATHPVNSEQRQSGILIPVLGQSSTKGWIIGEQVYITLGRSADLTLGLQYYSLRGYAESATFRAKGPGEDFFQAHFSALQDRGFTPENGTYTNQGGEDVTGAFRQQLTSTSRVVGDVEYLSSYVYREAFTDNFNQAVSSDITSIGYFTNQDRGLDMTVRADRYQGLKRVPVNTSPGEQVHILHVPSLDFTAVDHPLGNTPLLWSLTSSVAGLKRSQPNFTSSGVIERLDLRPQLALPLSGDGWHLLASVAARETFYTRSRVTPNKPGQPPIEATGSVNRANYDLRVAIRPPAIERTFQVPASLQRLFGPEVRHTVEPEITYRNTRGIDNFLSILRFDDVDLASDTNELEYGVTQHLYFRPRSVTSRPSCPATPATVALPLATTPPELPDVLNPSPDQSTDANGIPDASAQAPQSPTRTHAHPVPPHEDCAQAAAPRQHEWFSWRLMQRYFFDPTFGHAVITSRRNIFDSTLSLSGIAFLTEPRDISPLISRMRFRTSGHTDVEWDFDLDTGAKKFTSSNIFLDARKGQLFGGVSYALLNAPGRFTKETIDTNNNDQETLITSPTSNFKQMRVLGGFGDPNRPGLAVAANAGIDINLGQVQYAAIQTNYNWNCCGLSIEYRKYELGAVRNENTYRFNFTLANIGSAGNLRRAERLF